MQYVRVVWYGYGRDPTPVTVHASSSLSAAVGSTPDADARTVTGAGL